MVDVTKENVQTILLRLENTVGDLSAKSCRAHADRAESARYSDKADGIEYAIGVLSDYFEIEGLTYRRNAIDAHI